MTEDETRAELIDPRLKAVGWGVVEDTKVFRNHAITDGKIEASGVRGKPLRADYVLSYKGVKLAVIEAKSDELGVGEGVAQAKLYAEKLCLDTTYATNGKAIYSICMKSGHEGLVEDFLSPEALWDKTFAVQNEWREKFSAIPFETMGGTKGARYYQEIAVNRTLEAIASKQERILLTLATGTGKTFIAFQIAWKLFQTRWNLKRDGSRRPRILFLADRNILANQAFNSFSAFSEDALVRISPKEIAKKGSVPTNGSIFFTIFQTFMSGENEPYFGEYPKDYFDFIIIDECHRGSAAEDSAWREILAYFSSATHVGLTATPKETKDVSSIVYFGEPIYSYTLRQGIDDGFLAPYKVIRIDIDKDVQGWRPTKGQTDKNGELIEDRIYNQKDMDRHLVLEKRTELVAKKITEFSQRN